MKNKFIFSALLSGFMFIGLQAQEKEIKVSDGTSKEVRTMKVQKKVTKDASLAHPEANVNFDQNVSDVTLGQSQLTKKSLNYEGMVVGEKRTSIPILLEDAAVLNIKFKSDNNNALYYLTDRLENIVIPATEKEFNDKVPAGQYLLMVGLTPEAVKNEEKATFSFVVTK